MQNKEKKMNERHVYRQDVRVKNEWELELPF
jgi:hypothetical protein